MDLSRLIVCGHSFGGITALGASREDPRVKAVIGLDPSFFSHYKELNAGKFGIRDANQASCMIVTEGFYKWGVYADYKDYDASTSFSKFVSNSANKGKQAHLTLIGLDHENQMDLVCV